MCCEAESPARLRALEQRFGRDQSEQHEDQTSDRVLENRDEPPAEEFLHPQGEQLLLPVALHLAARPAHRLRLRAQPLARSLVSRSCSSVRANPPAPARLLSALDLADGLVGRPRRSSAGRGEVNLVRKIEGGVPAVARLEATPGKIQREAVRSSPISLSRSTARRRLMSSRKAIVSPASSSANWTMRSPGATRRTGASDAIRSSAACASSARRRSSSSIQSARSIARRAWNASCPLARSSRHRLRLQSRQVESVSPEGLGRRARGRPGELAPDPRESKIACNRSQPSRSERSLESASCLAATPSEALSRASSTSSHAVAGSGVSRSTRSMTRAVPLQLVAQALDRERSVQRVRAHGARDGPKCRFDFGQPFSRPAGDQLVPLGAGNERGHLGVGALLQLAERAQELASSFLDFARSGPTNRAAGATAIPHRSNRAGSPGSQAGNRSVLHRAAVPARTTRLPAP